MVGLLNIKNGLVVVLKENKKASDSLIKAYEKASWEEILKEPKKYSEIDMESSRMLQQYLFEISYEINPETYSNELKKAHKISKFKNNYVYLNYPYTLKEDKIPKALKTIGIQLKRRVEYLYVEWDEKEKKVSIRDKKKRPTEYDTTHAEVDEKTISLFDNVFVFNKTDFETIKKIENRIYRLEEETGISDATDLVLERASLKDKELYKVYDEFLLNEQNKNVIASLNHEFKHIKNSAIQESRLTKPNAGSICPEHAYEIEIEDERTASIEQILGDIKEYLQQDDLDNFYEIYCETIVDELEETKPEKRKELLLDKKYVINTILEDWNKNTADLYDEQLEECMKDYAASIPLHKTIHDKKERDIILNSFYSFSFYDPKSEKDEFVNVYSLIKPENRVKINSEARKKYILPAKNILMERTVLVQDSLHLTQIDMDIIKKAEEMSYHSLRENRKNLLRKHKIYSNKQNYFHQISELEKQSISRQQSAFMSQIKGR